MVIDVLEKVQQRYINNFEECYTLKEDKMYTHTPEEYRSTALEGALLCLITEAQVQVYMVTTWRRKVKG